MTDTSIEIVGLKDALRTLNKIDKVARRQVTKDYRQIVDPVVRDARAHIPKQAPLSGFKYPIKKGQEKPLWTGREGSAVRPYVSGKKPRTFGAYTSSLGVFGIRWGLASAALFDMSQNSRTRQGASMIDNLNRQFGNPSRIMWKAWERTHNGVEQGMRELVNRVMAMTQKELK